MKLKIENLNVEINNDHILKDISLGIEDGEFMSLLGPSGCGKSTMLKTIAGINNISSGILELDGEIINEYPAHKRGAVIVFQDVRLFPNMTVSENVAYPLRLKGMNKTDRLRKAEEYLSFVQLEGYGDRHINNISGGQQQRVALARALAAEPKLLLLDEPFSALDENLRADMRALVIKLHKQFNMTTIMVTHDREEAFSMADRIAIMDEGEILQVGAPDEVFSNQVNEKVNDYFKDCIYIKGIVKDGVFEGGGFKFDTKAPDGERVVLFNPK